MCVPLIVTHFLIYLFGMRSVWFWIYIEMLSRLLRVFLIAIYIRCSDRFWVSNWPYLQCHSPFPRVLLLFGNCSKVECVSRSKLGWKSLHHAWVVMWDMVLIWKMLLVMRVIHPIHADCILESWLMVTFLDISATSIPWWFLFLAICTILSTVMTVSRRTSSTSRRYHDIAGSWIVSVLIVDVTCFFNLPNSSV